MLARGTAYKCFSTPEEIAAFRAEAEAKGASYAVFQSPWRDVDTANHPDAPYAIRMKAPRTGETEIHDEVQGIVTIKNETLDDMIVLRSDNTRTYMLAVVVDDHDMGVTHVIRGDDHLNNAFRQLALIRAMQWPEPVYAHIPLIHGADGAKLSKRHGALGVDAYRDELGLLPEAVENYLLRLGWGHGDAEIISRDEAVQWFELAGVGRSPSRFDMKKLENLNGQHLRAADDGRLVALITGRVAAALGRELADSDTALLQRTMPELKKRANNLNDLAASSLFYLRSRPIPMDEGAAKLLASATPGLLDRARARFAAQDDWTAAALEQVARELAESEAAKLGQIAQPLRAAVTGSAQSPGLFEVLEVLGRQEVLGRIDDALAG
jgi:glutamyl-tRNA synthetase